MIKSNLKLDFPQNLKSEGEYLSRLGINTWEKIKCLRDKDITAISESSLSTPRNLKRLRCIAILVSELNIHESEAALLMHSGIASINALSILSPEELFRRTKRLEGLLKTGRKAIVDLEKANNWIKKAKDRQNNK